MKMKFISLAIALLVTSVFGHESDSPALNEKGRNEVLADYECSDFELDGNFDVFMPYEAVAPPPQLNEGGKVSIKFVERDGTYDVGLNRDTGWTVRKDVEIMEACIGGIKVLKVPVKNISSSTAKWLCLARVKNIPAGLGKRSAEAIPRIDQIGTWVLDSSADCDSRWRSKSRAGAAPATPGHSHADK